MEPTLRWTGVQIETSCFVVALIPDLHDRNDVAQPAAVAVISKKNLLKRKEEVP